MGVNDEPPKADTEMQKFAELPLIEEKDEPKTDPGMKVVIDDDEDEDESFVCKITGQCMKDFWYKTQLYDHMKKDHYIQNPAEHEKEEKMKKIRAEEEEKQKKLAAIRAEQQKQLKLSKKRQEKTREEEMKNLRAIHAERVRQAMEKRQQDKVDRESFMDKKIRLSNNDKNNNTCYYM